MSNGIDPNLGDYDARTAMHLAAASGAQKSIEYLLAHGGDPNSVDRWGGLPLMDAVKCGHRMETLVLKKHGGMLSKDGSSDASASQLCDAASSDDVRMLQLLKDAGVDLTIGDYDDRFALHLAASKGRLLAISYLLSICSNPNVKDRWGGTPIEDALKNGHFHCAKLLAANGGRLGDRITPELQQLYDSLESVSLDDSREALRVAMEKVTHCSHRSYPRRHSPAVHCNYVQATAMVPCHPHRELEIFAGGRGGGGGVLLSVANFAAVGAGIEHPGPRRVS